MTNQRTTTTSSNNNKTEKVRNTHKYRRPFHEGTSSSNTVQINLSENSSFKPVKIERSPYMTAAFESDFWHPNSSAYKNPFVPSSLNGNNGEWTNDDDRNGKKSGSKKNGKGKQNAGPNRQASMTPKKFNNSRNTVRPGKSQSRLTPATGLSNCVAKFYKVITDPFDIPSCQGACVPTYPSPPSQKYYFTTDVSFFAGTNGTGYLAVTPQAWTGVAGSITYTTTSNPDANVFTWTSAYVTSGYLAQAGFAGPAYSISQATGSGSENAFVRARIVGFGARVCYVGTELNTSGVYITGHDPAHSGILSSTAPVTLSTILSQPFIKRTPIVKGEWVEVNGFVATQNECDYTNYEENNDSNKYPWSNGTVDGGMTGAPGPPVIFIGVVDALPGSQFYVETITYIEYVPGASAGGSVFMSGMLSPSHADPQGFAVVQTAASNASFSVTGNREADWKRSMASALKGALRDIVPQPIRALVKGASHLM